MFSTTQSRTAIIKIIHEIMKKFLFGLFSIFLLTNLSFGQITNNGLKVIDSKTILTKESLYQDLISVNKLFYREYSINGSEIILNSLENPDVKLVSIKFKDQTKFSYLTCVFNTKTRDYANYYINTKENLVNVFDELKSNIYQVNIKDTTVNFNKSAFADCVGKLTDSFTDDLLGAVAYYTNPGIAVLIAAKCQGCVKKWWSSGCP